MLPSISSTYAKVRIEKIRWDFGFSSAVLEVDLLYKMKDKEIHLTGKNKVYMFGTKRGNLYKALKNGHYHFVSAICSQGSANIPNNNR